MCFLIPALRFLCTSDILAQTQSRCLTSSPSCRCASNFSVSFEIEIASSSPLHSCALDCGCCLTYNCRVSDFVHQHASSISIALWFPSACRTPHRTSIPARPSPWEVDAAGTLPLLPLLPSVFVSFVNCTHRHLPSNSSD